MGKKPYWWLAVTPDEYELPLAVEETAKEIGAVFGVTKNGVLDAVRKNRNGVMNGYKFVKVRKTMLIDEYDIVTHCDIFNNCEDCPRYGDDCDGRGEDDE